MKPSKLTGAAIICALMLILAGWTISRPAVNIPATPQWEYKIVYLKDNFKPVKNEEAVNALGAQGWELVSVTRVYMNGGPYDGENFYFKRQK
jgi:hypothetical protein